jgi:hypothetical protein
MLGRGMPSLNPWLPPPISTTRAGGSDELRQAGSWKPSGLGSASLALTSWVSRPCRQPNSCAARRCFQSIFASNFFINCLLGSIESPKD